jgi:hypothetical protein
MRMLNFNGIITECFVEELERAYLRTYSDKATKFGSILVWAGRLALENIANSDALYHNVEHTAMVGLAGQSILEGKHLCEGGVTPKNWMHFMIALLCHDIGYVKGVCQNDGEHEFATGKGGETVKIPSGSTDVALTPYHVDRSKLFVRDRFGTSSQSELPTEIEAEVVASYIEMTRFPVLDGENYQDTKGYPGLVRAADFIGQLGDPDYLRKCSALYYEFEEIGGNDAFGYLSPGDLRDNYAKFYWDVVNPYIKDALYYLRLTQEGKQWIANLNANVFVSEHKIG